MRYLILLSLLSASACFDTHQSRSHTGGGDSKGEVEVETSVDKGKFKVSLTGAQPLLFEVNERLLFNRLVYEKGGEVCLVKPNSLTIAGGKVEDKRCYEDKHDTNFIRACIELEREGDDDGKQYDLVVDVSDNSRFVAAKCKLADDSDELVLPVSLLTGDTDSKLPKGYAFDASNINTDNLKTVMENAKACVDHVELKFDSSNYTCTCMEGNKYEADDEFADKIFGDKFKSGECKPDNKTAYLLKPLAKPKQQEDASTSTSTTANPQASPGGN